MTDSSSTPSTTDLMTTAAAVRPGRRGFLKLALAGAAAVPAASALSACATGGGSGSSGQATVAGQQKSDSNPFGIDPKATVDVVIFKGGFGDQYGIDAGKAYDTLWKGSGVAKVTSTTKINTQLQPRFVGGNPPDVIDNSGADSISFAGIQDKVETLDDLLEAPAIGFEGKKVKDVLIPGATDPGTFDGKLLQMNYFYTVYSLWYGAKLFKDNGFTAPTTWDETMALGEKAKSKGLSLFVFGGQNAASYYHEFAISMAVRQGGKDVLTPLEKLDKDSYQQDSVQAAFKAIKAAVDAGYFLPGGSGMIHTQAQTQFVQGKALLYPSGSWLENEMIDITPQGFEMTSLQVPALGASPKLEKGFHGAAGEPFIVPKGKNPAGGKEFLRVMLSKDAASNTSKLVKSATVVQGTVPDDGFGSTALASATKIQNAGLSEVYDWRYNTFYGMGKDIVTIWNTFLSGGSSVQQLTSSLQGLSDKVREDPSIKKFSVS
ncbi:N-acetylglucosamine/diacetylchitobiose ABC transporter substrate-binding protein [Lapillicoccus jejuensis]|nr:N-acetylglucosamine/diacetylchitobiose ABC transporter substrate-binding protein [Lapillicoccus jejuensis]